MQMGRETIRDSHGKVLYTTQEIGNKIEVRDAHGKLLGYCSHGETRDAHGMLVARDEVPALLYED
jgi:hypothetical protein